MRLNILSERGIDTALVPFARSFKEAQNIGIQTQRNLLLLLRGNERTGSCPLHLFGLTWNVAVVDLGIRHGRDPFQPLALFGRQRRRRIVVKLELHGIVRAHKHLPFLLRSIG